MPDLGTSRCLSLLWGAHGVRADEVSTYEVALSNATAHAVEEGFARSEDLVVGTAAIPFAVAGTTKGIRIIQIPAT